MRSRYIRIGGAIALALLAAFYFAVDPAEARWIPKCLIYQTTGFKCAGCGSQRAIHSLLHGDIAGAWEMNALFVILLPVLLFLAWLEFRRKVHPVLYRKVYTPTAIAIFGIVVTGWTIFRNLAL